MNIRRLIQGVASWLLPCVTGADLSTLSELMKEVYDPVIEEQQNLEAMTWREFADGDDELGGQGWFFETKMAGNQAGIGARQERGTLPEPSHQDWKQGKIYWALCYGAGELTGPVIEAAKSNLKAFANARTEEIEGLTRDVIKDFNRQVFGDGSGVLAACTGANVAAVVSVDNDLNLRTGMIVDVWDAAAPATPNGTDLTILTLTDNGDGTVEVTFDATPGTDLAAGDVLIRADAAYVDTVRISNEMTGLQAIIDDGTLAATFENISRTTYPLWKGHVLANGGTNRNLTLDLLQQAEDNVYRAAGSRPDWMRMNLGQRRKFFDLVSGDRRYQSRNFDAGFERLDYNGNMITVDIDCPKNKIICATKRTIKKYTLRKFGLLDFDGLVLRQVANKDVWRFYVGLYGNLGSKRPNCNAIITDLTEPEEKAWLW